MSKENLNGWYLVEMDTMRILAVRGEFHGDGSITADMVLEVGLRQVPAGPDKTQIQMQLQPHPLFQGSNVRIPSNYAVCQCVGDMNNNRDIGRAIENAVLSLSAPSLVLPNQGG